MVLCVTLLRIPSDPFFAYRRLSTIQLAANLALMQNLIKSSDAIGPLWSLPWEVQMYTALPFLFLVSRRGNIISLAAVALATVAANIFGIVVGIRGTRILDYAPCFMGGVLAYMLIRRTPPKLPAWLWPCTLAVMGVLLIVSPQALAKRRIYWGYWATCAILGALIPVFKDLSPSWLTRTAHRIAQYSYGIYLFHVPAMWLAFDYLRGMGAPLSMVVFVGATVGLSVTAYHLIEHPLIELGRQITAVGVRVQRVAPALQPGCV